MLGRVALHIIFFTTAMMAAAGAAPGNAAGAGGLRPTDPGEPIVLAAVSDPAQKVMADDDDAQPDRAASADATTEDGKNPTRPGVERGRYNPGGLTPRVTDQKSKTVSLPTLEIGYTSHRTPGEKNAAVCRAHGSVTYGQMDRAVFVEATLENEDCAASYGQYRVRLITRDLAGTRHNMHHIEDWARTDAEPVLASHEYVVAAGHELVRVTLTAPGDTGCICATP